MDFFGLGAMEILLIVVVALILFGPGRIVEISRTMGKAVNAIKKATSDLTTAVVNETNALEKEGKQLKTELTDVARTVQSAGTEPSGHAPAQNTSASVSPNPTSTSQLTSSHNVTPTEIANPEGTTHQ